MNDNSAGWLVKAIRDDYTLPPGFETKAVRDAKRDAASKRKAAAIDALKKEEVQRAAEKRLMEERIEMHLASLPTAEARETFEEEAARNHPLYKQYAKAKAEGGELYRMWRFSILKPAVEIASLRTS